ncbi:caspase, EACC1-associated type [Nostoc sp. DedSLP04]|uniref:caspase, EACC1-associated type n=1 Tax=Nostoc sp. DedSLP04 TaxID=3075401 RepID=UPI002AD4AFA6|nr:ABC transporter substrate-binding protein [Nostoc sp. DedSLP04]MDZ8035683.1 ABC transporter substrate-binding protein [Nostoc sp. DedSLP04]
MAKVALLIGVSEYGADITSLLAATKDVEAMQRVLLNPEMGGFTETDVVILKNPDRQEVENAIYRLFANRQREDLLLFYFSGHGIKDENGKLYLSNCNTCKDNGRLFKPSALAASVLNENMNESKSERQVVILDCCFSGAIARDMIPRDGSTVNLQEELGGKGRAILTSSTSTQYAFEQEGLELSVYTRYLVEGIEKGAADKDGDGQISVDELHEYASIKVKQEAPAMTPKIYPVEEGYKIYIAKAPKGDPKLIYRKLVQELAKEGSGEIHELDRITLEVKQESLQLTLEDTKSIEVEVLKPYQEYKRKLQKYEEAFCKARESDSNLSDKTRTKLKRLQELLVLGDDDINPIEARICEIQPSKIIDQKDEETAKIETLISDEQPTTPPPVNPQLTRNSNLLYYIIGACTIGVIGVVIGANLDLSRQTASGDKPLVNSCAQKETYNLNDSISLGEEILDKRDTNLDKKAGAQEFAKDNCQIAINKFDLYRKEHPTDPEALIYLNNAKARQQRERLKIAVSVPIDTDPDLAKEILRGVAQAQDEVNNNNSINGKLLQVAIANDDEKSGTPRKIANALVGDPEILGVVGAASSNATLEAGKVYKDKLVAISPTSTAVNISGSNSYIFRTVFSDELPAQKLANYMVKLQKKNAVVFYNSTNLYSISLKDKFVKAVQEKRGKVSLENQFDLNSDNFDAENAIKQVINQDAVLMLISDSETLEKADKVIQANNHKLHIFGGDNVFSLKTLNSWGKQAEGMVVAVPWDISNASNLNFVNNSKTLWKSKVNWRTATAYDATQAIIAGLRKNNTREGLQQELHKSDFSFDGATGKIQFLPSGDRKYNPIFLVQVKQKPDKKDEYEFVPIQP